MSLAKLVCSVVLFAAGCSGQVKELDPEADYAQALCDRAAACGAPFEDSIAQAVDLRPEDPSCAPDLASWMSGQAPGTRNPGPCFRALARAVRENGCEVSFTMPEVCK